MLIIGIFFAVLSTISFFSTKNKLGHYIHADGLVVKRQTCDTEKIELVKHNIIFSTLAGDKIDFFSLCSKYPKYNIGQKVKIIYPQNNPSGAELANNINLYLLVLILSMISLGFLIIAFFILFLGGKRSLEGESAAWIFFIFSTIGGILTVFIGSNYWLNAPEVSFIGVGIVIFGSLVLVWEKVKNIFYKG